METALPSSITKLITRDCFTRPFRVTLRILRIFRVQTSCISNHLPNWYELPDSKIKRRIASCLHFLQGGSTYDDGSIIAWLEARVLLIHTWSYHQYNGLQLVSAVAPTSLAHAPVAPYQHIDATTPQLHRDQRNPWLVIKVIGLNVGTNTIRSWRNNSAGARDARLSI